MAQVPYSPVPTAQPTAPGESVSISTPGAAFGENIGAAIEKLGSTVGQVGNELFARSIALQDLADENAARAAQTKFAMGASQLHAEYSAKTGKDAADSLQGFLDAQAQLRQQVGSGLGAPQARKYYDADSLPFMQRNIFSAAAHAAEENKKYTVGTYNATADTYLKEIGDNPASFEDNRQRFIEAKVNAASISAGVHDPNDPIIRDTAMNAKSAATKEFLLGIGKTNAEGAIGLMPKYRQDLTDPDYLAVQGVLEGRASAVASSNIADRLVAKHGANDGTFDASPAQMIAEGQAEMKKLQPDNERGAIEVQNAIRTRINEVAWQNRRDVADATMQATNQILQGNITDEQHFRAMPNSDQLISRLPQAVQSDLSGFINRTRDQAFKTTNQGDKLILKGMSNNNVEEFLNQDLSQWQLGSNDRIEMENLQTKLASKPQSDARIPRAFGYIRAVRGTELQSLGIDTRTKENAEDYYHFQGALSEALDIWIADHGKPPTPEEIADKIGPELIRTQAAKQGWWGSIFGGQESAFKQWNRATPEEVPPEFREQLSRGKVEKGGAMPTENQIYRAYLRDQFLKLYPGASTGGSPTTKPTRPRPGDNIPN